MAREFSRRCLKTIRKNLISRRRLLHPLPAEKCAMLKKCTMLIQFQPRQEVCDAYLRRRQYRTGEYILKCTVLFVCTIFFSIASIAIELFRSLQCEGMERIYVFFEPKLRLELFGVFRQFLFQYKILKCL